MTQSAICASEVCFPSSYSTGKERDQESGLDYFGARYYASSIGRFMSPDPSGLSYADPTNPQSLNLYSYVRNNPLTNTDPTGMECVWDDGSFDSADDKQTGNAEGCSSQGGTYVNPDLFENAQLTNGQQANYNRGDWSSSANSTLQQSWVDPSATANADPNNVPLSGDFSFPGMNQSQVIKMMQNAGFVVSPMDTLLSKITKSHPGTNMRSANPICSVHLNLTPGSGQNGAPTTGNFHFDLFSPLSPGTATPDPAQTAAHATFDVVPDLLIQGGYTTHTGNQLCK
jgi:RHS repeat-associated protein